MYTVLAQGPVFTLRNFEEQVLLSTMEWESTRHNISIILVEPEHPGNMGSVARAMQSAGLSRLILVNPVAFTEETWWLAHASEQILHDAVVVPTLTDAARLVDRLVVTSAKARTHAPPLMLAEASPVLHVMSSQGTLGIVFGRERTGLTSAELALGETALTIPSFTSYPSLNLAMAVTIVLYELQRDIPHQLPESMPPAPMHEKLSLADHFCRTLDLLKYYPPDHERVHQSMTAQFTSMLNAAAVTSRQVRLLHKYFHIVEKGPHSE